MAQDQNPETPKQPLTPNTIELPWRASDDRDGGQVGACQRIPPEGETLGNSARPDASDPAGVEGGAPPVGIDAAWAEAGIDIE